MCLCSRGPSAFKKLDRRAARETIAKEPHIPHPIPSHPIAVSFEAPLKRKPRLLQRRRRRPPLSRRWIGRRRRRRRQSRWRTNQSSDFVRNPAAAAEFGNQRMQPGKRSSVGAREPNKAMRSPSLLPSLPLTLFAPVYTHRVAKYATCLVSGGRKSVEMNPMRKLHFAW